MKDKVLIFTGAGLSASSGISTFRDKDGLWEKHKIEEICSAGCLDWNYENTINFYNLRRQDIKDKKPNNAHLMCARLKEKYEDKIEVITQNIDDLLQRAKCKDVVHLHGFLRELRCMSCDEVIDIAYQKQDETNSSCSFCKGKLRPNVVFFGEAAPMYATLNRLLQNCSLLVVIGTSGNVIDVNYLSSFAKYSILNNLEESDVIEEENFDKIYYEDADTAYEKLEKHIENFINKGELD